MDTGRSSGAVQGITLRDLVNAIPLYAIKQGLMTVAKQGKKNIFSDALAERSAAACAVHLDRALVIEYLRSNIILMKWMIANGAP